MQVTLRDIAKELDVSHATVSRVLNRKDDHLISEATRARVRQTARDMGYRPNLAARALATGRTRTVAVWMPTLYTPFYAQALNALERQITGHGYGLTIGRWPAPAAGLADLRERSAADGLLVMDLIKDSPEAPPPGAAPGLPAVFLGAHCPTDTDHVRVDLTAGAREAVRHLLAGGGRPAYLVSGPMAHPGEARYDAYLSEMAEAGQAPQVIPLPAGDRAGARMALADFLRGHPRPDGLFCQNDDVALGALRALRDRGLRVPDDVRLVGCDGIEEAEYWDPPLSTVTQPLEEVCALAWQFLARRLEEPDAPPQRATLSAQLVVRESSRPSQ